MRWLTRFVPGVEDFMACYFTCAATYMATGSTRAAAGAFLVYWWAWLVARWRDRGF